MPLRINQFGGIVPKLGAPELLPENGAQTALNCNLAAGALEPLAIGAPFGQSWDSVHGRLKAGLSTDDVFFLNKPSAPTVLSQNPICKPLGINNDGSGGWLQLNVFVFQTWVDGSGNVQGGASPISCWSSTPSLGTGQTVLSNLQYTPNGLTFHAHWSGGASAFAFNPNQTYCVYGPIYQFVLNADPKWNTTTGLGGPAVNNALPGGSFTTVPNRPLYSDANLPGGTVPLSFNGLVYGFFQPVDVRGPIYDGHYLYGGTSPTLVPIPGFDADFTINLNYKESRIRYYIFGRSYLDSQQREGPPSNPSALVLLNPGEQLVLNTATDSFFPVGGGQKLYRAGRDGQEFALLDQWSGVNPEPGMSVNQWQVTLQTNLNQWLDVGLGSQARHPIPPFGNYAGVIADNPTLLTEQFLPGSLVHSSQFGAAFYNDATANPPRHELWLSDLYRLHVWPKEYVIPFKSPIMAITQSEGKIFVFTCNGDGTPGKSDWTGDVYAVSGSHPADMSKILLSASTPLLNAASLCGVGHYVFWVTADGLACNTWRGVEIVTRDFFTRTDWLAMNPGNDFVASVADNAIFLIHATDAHSPNLKIDLQSYYEVAAISTLTAAAGVPVSSGGAQWKSKRFRSEQPVLYDWARVVGDGAATLNIYLDGAANPAKSYALTAGATNFVSLADPAVVPAKAWEFEWTGVTAPIHEALFVERKILPAAETTRLSAQDVTVWEDVWLKFEGANRFVAGSVAAHTTEALSLSLRDRDGQAVYGAPIGVGGAQIFQIPRLAGSQAAPALEIWRLGLSRDVQDTLDPGQRIEEVVLYTRRTIAVGKTIREVHPGQGVPPWWFKRYELEDRVWLKSLLVNHQAPAGTNVNIRLYLDGSATPSQTQAVVSGQELRLADSLKCSMLEFDFVDDGGNGMDAAVSEVLIFGREARMLDENGVNLSGEDHWRARLFKFAERGAFACGAVSFNPAGAPPTLSFYQDGAPAPAFSQTVSDGKMFYLPRALGFASLWEADLNPNGNQVDGLVLKPRRRIPVTGAALRLVNDNPALPPWSATVYEFPANVGLVSGQVKADAYPLRMNLYANGAQAPTQSLSITDGNEFRIDAMNWLDALEIDFVDGSGMQQDWQVREISLFAREAVPIGTEGVRLLDPPHLLGHYFKSPDLTTFACGALETADTTGLTLTLTPMSGSAVTLPVNGPGLFYLPRNLVTSPLWRVDVQAREPVTSLVLKPRTRVAVAGSTLHVIAPEPNFPPWTFTRYTFTESVRIVSVWIRAKDGNYPLNMNFFRDGQTQMDSGGKPIPDASVTFPLLANPQLSGREARVDGLPPLETLEFNFTDPLGNPLDGGVIEVCLFCLDPLAIGPAGYVNRNSRREHHFRHRTFEFNSRGSFSVVRVTGADYTNMMLTLYAEGQQVYGPVAVTEDGEIRLPLTLPEARQWEMDLDHQGEIDEIYLLGRVTHEVKEGRFCVRKEDDPFTWKGHRILAERPLAFTCGRIMAASYPVTLNLYQEGKLMVTRTIAGREPFRLPRLRPERTWEMDILENPANGVTQAELATSMEALRL